MRPIWLPRAERQTRPWKNGGGSTQDVVAYPSGRDLDGFDWRLSIADVTQDGPFSTFEDIERHLAVLSGEMLLVTENRSVHLRAGDRPLAFAGDQPSFARLIEGHARDLNLMVRTSVCAGRLRDVQAGDIVCVAATTILVAVEETGVAAASTSYCLGQFDAIMLNRGSHVRTDQALIAAEIDPH